MVNIAEIYSQSSDFTLKGRLGWCDSPGLGIFP